MTEPDASQDAGAPLASAKQATSGINSLNAITLATHNMARATAFYRALGFDFHYGGGESSFTSFKVGSGHLNLVLAAPDVSWSWWGRAIFYVDDVDAVYMRAATEGLHPEAPPRDAEWHERYFQIIDPDGHELSFAKPLL